jgi:uncharacterized protein YjiK
MKVPPLKKLAGLMLFCALLLSFKSDIPKHKIRPFSQKTLQGIPEPSDIVFDSVTARFYIVSDHGILFECDTMANILRTAEVTGKDYEGVEVKDGLIYVSDERPRMVFVYDQNTLKLVAQHTIPFGGEANSGFESITYNYSKRCWVMVSEKDPITIVELDSNFKILNQQVFTRANDISSARWWRGSMYLLSDENACIFRCDPVTYEPQEKYSFSMLNPEGLCFTPQGQPRITSDDMQTLYYFTPLLTDK